MNENDISKIIVDCAYKIHIKIGSGLFESVYECILEKYLTKRGLDVKRQVPMPMEIEDIQIDRAFIADLIINDKVIIEIEDNGIGLKNDNVDEIFDPLYSTKSPQEGMGLGLAIVQNFITQMDGTIRCYNKADEGVIFSISLPLKKDKQ